MRSRVDLSLIDFLHMFTYSKLKQKLSPYRCTNVFEEAFVLCAFGTTWGSYKCFTLFLPVPKSVLQLIGAIQKKQKGSGGQPCTDTRASLLATKLAAAL